MRKLKNEEGYALLLVLLLVVFITIITAVFMRGSISNAKQERITDNSHLTVVTAEAGVDYYKTSLVNTYFTNLTNLDQIAENEIVRQKDEIAKRLRTAIDYSEVKDKVLSKLKYYLQEDLDDLVLKNPVLLNKSYSFTVNRLDNQNFVSIENDAVIFKASITGESSKIPTDKSLSLKINFPVKDFSGSSSSETQIDMNNLYPDDSLIPACGSSKDINNQKCKSLRNTNYEQIKNHSTVYFPQGYYRDNEKLDLKSNSTVYSKYPSNEKEEGFKVSELIVKNHSLFLHNGSLKTQLLDVKNFSNFFLTGSSLNVVNKSEFKDHSTVSIQSSSRFYSDLAIKQNTTVCIYGALTVDGKFELKENSKIYIYGRLNKQPSGDGEVYEKGPTEVFSFCSASSSQNTTWPLPDIDVSYNKTKEDVD